MLSQVAPVALPTQINMAFNCPTSFSLLLLPRNRQVALPTLSIVMGNDNQCVNTFSDHYSVDPASLACPDTTFPRTQWLEPVLSPPFHESHTASQVVWSVVLRPPQDTLARHVTQRRLVGPQTSILDEPPFDTYIYKGTPLSLYSLSNVYSKSLIFILRIPPR